MSNIRQRMEQINIGILVLRGAPWVSGFSEVEKQALAEWLVVDRIAILTGFIGEDEREREHEGALKQETWNEGHAAHQCKLMRGCKLKNGKALMSASAVADAN